MGFKEVSCDKAAELLPCPFCGGEAEVIEADYGMYMTGYAVYCRKCCLKLGVTGRLGETYEWSPVFNTEAEAIAAWNTRVDYHGYEQAAIEAWESIKAWNMRVERTCEMRADGAHCMNGVEFYECRSCGEYACIPTVMGKSEPPRYCPNCGRRCI